MEASLATLPSLPEGLFARIDADPHGLIALSPEPAGFVPMRADEFRDRVRHRAKGLLRLGLKAGDRVALMAPNSVDWAITDFAILAAGAVTVPIYPSYGRQEVLYVLHDSGAAAAFLEGAEELARLGDFHGAGLPHGRVFLRDGERARSAGLRSWAELDQDGTNGDDGLLAARLQALTRDSLATIVYTSGTTGWPKGAMLTHGNILSNIEGFLPYAPLRSGQRVLSFLPLSHVFERGTGHFGAYLLGLEIAYAERPDTVLRDIARASPHILISVPRVFQLLHGRVRRELAARPGLAGILLRQAVGKDGKGGRGPLAWAARKMLAGGLRRRMGGRLLFFVSGGAPLGPEIARFFLALGLPILEGYGMTEASPVIAANPLHAIRPGTVGRCLPNLECRLAPDGEILVRGPSIMVGYWNNETATREALVDGWLHTGDIGMLDADGYLTITDRKKDLIVNSAGENIAPQKIEMRLMTHPLIEQAVVFGDRLPYLVALIYPQMERAKELLGPEPSPEALQESIRHAVQETLAGLPSFEQIRRFTLLPAPLSQEGGELTPTLKVKRNVVRERYGDALAALYR